MEASCALAPHVDAYVIYISVPRAVLAEDARQLVRFNTAQTTLDQLRVLVEILERKERQCFN